MKRTNRIIGIILAISIILTIVTILASPANATDAETQLALNLSLQSYPNATTIYLFWRDGCPHCLDELTYLKELREKKITFNLKTYETYYHPENRTILTGFSKTYQTNISGVPATFIGTFKPIVGFAPSFKNTIIKEINYCNSNRCKDPYTLYQKSLSTNFTEKPNLTNSTYTLFGHNINEYSLPLFTIIIASLDSFNPCCFFILFFLLSLLLYTKSRKRIILIGIIYTFFAGAIYYIIMAGWLNVITLLSGIKTTMIFAGLFALTIAIVNIKDFFAYKKGVSFTISDKNKPKLFTKMRKLVNAKSFSTMILATIVLSITGNLYAGLCSAGFPLVYTTRLASTDMTTLARYIYMLYYILIYLIPYIIIVTFMAITFKSKKITEDIGEFLKLISGLMLTGLALSLIFNPTLLNNPLYDAGLLGIAIFLSLFSESIRKSINKKPKAKELAMLNIWFALLILSLPIVIIAVSQINLYLNIMYYISSAIFLAIINTLLTYQGNKEKINKNHK